MATHMIRRCARVTSLDSFDVLQHVVALHILDQVDILALNIEVCVVCRLMVLLHLERVLLVRE